MEAIINDFKNWMIANSLSPETVRNRIVVLGKIIREMNINIVTDFTEKTVIEYIAKKKGNSSQALINSYLSTIKAFLDFNNVLIRLPKGKTSTAKIVEVLPEKEFVEKVLPTIDIEFRNSLQVKAYLYFIYYGGLRVSDSSLIKRSSFNFRDGYFTSYISKQKMFKKTPISIKMKELLLQYFAVEAEETNAFNLTVPQIRGIIKRVEQYFPGLKLNPHKFRKSCATNAYKMGMNLEEVQKFMGHKNISTTQRYVEEVKDEELRTKFLKLEEEQMKKRKKQGGICGIIGIREKF